MCASTVVSVLQGLLTLVIAIVATYIAWQQWKGNQRKLRIDQYDRRLGVYREVIKTISSVSRDANIKIGELAGFMAASAEADFLFGPEIRQYVDEIFQRGVKLHTANSQYKDRTQEPPPGYDHMAIVNEMTSQTGWFLEQHSVALAKFKPYLDLSE